MHPLRGMVDSWGALALSVTWQLAALAVVAWLCETLFRLRHARARHSLWWFVLVAPLLLAPGRMMLERRDAVVRVAAPEAVVRVVRLETPGIERPRAAPPLVDTGPVARESARPVASWWDAPPLTYALGAAWVLGCVSLALRLFVGHLRVRRMIADSQPVAGEAALKALVAGAGVRLEVSIRTSASVGAPVLYGLRRPTILLPEGWVESLSPEDLRALLAHEVAHIKRRDFLANFLQRLVEIPLFFHPGAWLASHRIALAREELADAWALTNGADAVSYARALSAAAERTQTRLSVASVGVAEGRSTLLRRVEAIMRGPRLDRMSGPVWVALICAVLVSAGAFGGVQVCESPREEPPPLARPSPDPPAEQSPAAPETTTVIHGLLRTPDGRPASGVTVHMEGSSFDSHRPETHPTQAVTGDEGRFEIVLKSGAGKRTLWVLDDQFYAILARDIQSRTGGKLTLPPVTLQRTGRIEGRVLDAVGGAPVSGVAVTCSPVLASGVMPNHVSCRVKASADGTFAIAAPPGEASLQVIPPPGYTWVHLITEEKWTRDRSVLLILMDPERPTGRVLTVQPGATLTDMDVFVAPGLALRGSVLTSEGTPWEHGGFVYAVQQPGRVVASRHISSFGQIATDGTFQIGSLMSGVPTVIFVLDEERSQGGAVLVTPSASHKQDVAVKVESLALLKGRVLLPDGIPAAGAALKVDGLFRGILTRKPPPPVRSGPDGTFEFRQGIVGVPWRVEAELPPWTAGGPYPKYYGSSESFEVAPGQGTLDIGDIVLEPYEPPKTSGRISDTIDLQHMDAVYIAWLFGKGDLSIVDDVRMPGVDANAVAIEGKGALEHLLPEGIAGLAPTGGFSTQLTVLGTPEAIADLREIITTLDHRPQAVIIEATMYRGLPVTLDESKLGAASSEEGDLLCLPLPAEDAWPSSGTEVDGVRVATFNLTPSTHIVTTQAPGESESSQLLVVTPQINGDGTITLYVQLRQTMREHSEEPGRTGDVLTAVHTVTTTVSVEDGEPLPLIVRARDAYATLIVTARVAGTGS